MKNVILFSMVSFVFLFKGYECIVGGERVQVGAVPYQAAIFNEKQFVCSGSLISSEWVLTAAECVQSTRSAPWIIDFKKFDIVLGAINIKQYERFSEYKMIKDIVIHPNYYDTTQEGNIALIQLSLPATFSDTIQMIPLAEEDDYKRPDAYVSGWGKTGLLAPPSYVLMQARVNIISQEECTSMYFFNRVLPVHICTAGALYAGKGACTGDAGAPLILGGEEPVQIGVVVYPPAVCEGFTPTVYIKVFKYKSWIEEHIEKDKVNGDDNKDNTSKENKREIVTNEETPQGDRWDSRKEV